MAAENDLTPEQVAAANAAMLAAWLRRDLGRPPSTVEARLNDLMGFLRHAPPRLLVAMEESHVVGTVQGLRISSRSKERMANSIKSFRAFAEGELCLKPPKVRWWKMQWRKDSREHRLLLPSDLERVLAQLARMGERGQETAAAALLGYFFGLRVTEVCHLQIGDLQLMGEPTIHVRNSKRNHSRIVVGVQVPAEAVALLTRYQQRKLDEAHGKREDRLLNSRDGRIMTRHRLGRILAYAMKRAGVERRSDQKRSSFHSLRHACANRWLALGVPVRDIARKLGHRSLDTTIQEYLHVFHFLHQDAMERADRDRGVVRVRYRAAGKLLGLSVGRTKDLSLLNAEEALPDRVSDVGGIPLSLMVRIAADMLHGLIAVAQAGSAPLSNMVAALVFPMADHALGEA